MDKRICSSSVSIRGGSLVGGAVVSDLEVNGKTIIEIFNVIKDVKRKSFQVSFYCCLLLHFQIGKRHCSRKSIIMKFFLLVENLSSLTDCYLFKRRRRRRRRKFRFERKRKRERTTNARLCSLACRCLPVD